jgi:hypothetical protein
MAMVCVRVGSVGWRICSYRHCATTFWWDIITALGRPVVPLEKLKKPYMSFVLLSFLEQILYAPVWLAAL